MLDREAWQAVTDDQRDRRTHGRLGGMSRAVGSCLLHVVDPEKQRYVVREGSLDIAQITREGILLLVAGIAVGEFAVGVSSDLVLASHPPDAFLVGCGRSELGSFCSVHPIGSELNAMFDFLVDGELPEEGLLGTPASKFFRHKTLRGVLMNSRLD